MFERLVSDRNERGTRYRIYIRNEWDRIALGGTAIICAVFSIVLSAALAYSARRVTGLEQELNAAQHQASRAAAFTSRTPALTAYEYSGQYVLALYYHHDDYESLAYQFKALTGEQPVREEHKYYASFREE